MLLVNVHNIIWKKHHTQKDVIQKTGLSSETVNRLWKGEYYNFTFERVKKLAKVYAWKAMDLLVEIPDEQ